MRQLEARPAPRRIRGRAGPAPRPPRRADALLALQRSAGNAAATQLLQRAIGFEFELNDWYARRPARRFFGLGPRYSLADASLFTQQGAGWPLSERMKRKERLISGNRFSLEADDRGAQSALEFVTDAFDETPAGAAQLTTTLRHMARVTRRILANYPAAPAAHFPTAAQLGGVTVDDPNTFVYTVGGDNTFQGRPQTTFGIRLDQLAAFLEDVFAPAAPADPAALALRRQLGRQELTGRPPGAGAGPRLRTLGQSPATATAALNAYALAHPGAPAPPSGEVVSLLALVYSYLEIGRQPLVTSYAKTIAPVMARTDFRALFTLLPPNEQAYYGDNDGAHWVALVASMPNYNAPGALDQPLYASGITGPSQEPSNWYQDLSRRAWVTAMARNAAWPWTWLGGSGRDLLSPKYFPTRRGRKQIESLAALQGRTEAVGGGVQGGIFELRTVPLMTMAAFRPWARRVHRYIVGMNALAGRTYGE
jgi:hypothetical protein